MQKRRYKLSTIPLLLIGVLFEASAACQVCNTYSFAGVARREPSAGIRFAAVRSVAKSRPLLVAGALVAHRLISDRVYRSQGQEEIADSDGTAGSDSEAEVAEEEEPLSSAMIVSIGFYKKFISPLLPPACRFVPTCSQYGVQAISEFGPSKGAILIAWRLLRCSPIGGKGYDPPKWPPVAFTFSSY